MLEVDFQEPNMVNDSGNPARSARPMFLATIEALHTIEQNLTNRTLLARVVRAENLARDGGRALLGMPAAAPNEKRPAPAASTESRLLILESVIPPA